MPSHTRFARSVKHFKRGANKLGELGTKGVEAGKRGFDTLRGKASAGVEEVKLKTGSAAGRANERVKTGEKQNFSSRKSNVGSAPEPAGGRVSGGGARGALRTGIRGALRAGRAFGPAVAVGSIAAEVGLTAGEKMVTPDTLRLLDKGESSGARSAKFFGLSGGSNVSGITGLDTLDALNEPDQVRPSTDSGGFFPDRLSSDGTRMLSLNPGRSRFELDQGSTSLNSAALTRDQLLRGKGAAPLETEEEQTVDTEGRTFATKTNPTLDEATEGDPNNQRQSLRDALAGFERTDNALGDAMALNARLGLAGAFNKGLGDRNKFGLDERKFGLEQDKFGETKRQNTFSNAIDLHSARMDELTAAGAQTKAEADGRKAENASYIQQLNNATSEQQKTDLTFNESRRGGHDRESTATQTMMSIVMREVKAEEDTAVGKIFNAIMPGFLGGGDPFGSITDAFDGKAQLLDAASIDAFSIQDGGLYADKGDGVPSFIASLSDFKDTSAQFLQEVLATRKSLRQ